MKLCIHHLVKINKNMDNRRQNKLLENHNEIFYF
jgi:hypothetical protein